MRYRPGLVLSLVLLFAACAQTEEEAFTFQGEIPLEGKLVYRD